jgi:putative ABC transport system permease protein
LTNRVVLANLFHRRMRTVLAILAIGMEVSMILLMLGLADGLVGESTRKQKGIGADILILDPTASGAWSAGSANLPEELVTQIAQTPGVAIVMGRTFSMQAQLQTVTGVDLELLEKMSGGLRFRAGGPFEGPFDVIVDDVYARQKKASVGDTLSFFNRDFRLTGIVEGGQMSRIFVPLRTMQEVMGWESKLSQIYVKLEDPSQARRYVEQFKQQLPEHPIYTMEEFMSLFTVQTRGMADEFVNVIIGIAMVVGFIVVLMSMYTAVLDRTRDIGILKALGASPGYIVDIFLREALVLTLCGVAVGIGLSYAAQAQVVERFPLVTLIIERQHLVWAVVVSVIASLIGSLYPALKAARHDALEALAYE